MQLNMTEGKTAAGDPDVYRTAYYRKCFSAALQYGRHHHCGALCWCRRAGCRRFYRYDHVSHHRFFPGDHRRFFCPRLPEIRRDWIKAAVKRNVANGILLICYFYYDYDRIYLLR